MRVAPSKNEGPRMGPFRSCPDCGDYFVFTQALFAFDHSHW